MRRTAVWCVVSLEQVDARDFYLMIFSSCFITKFCGFSDFLCGSHAYVYACVRFVINQ